jgi:hypothetical protein
MMATPAERIYEAAVARTVEGGATLGRLTSAVAALFAAATAVVGVLVQPATNGLENAEWAQITFLAIAFLGFVILVVWGRDVLLGVDIPGPLPKPLYRAARDAGTLEEPNAFHLEAAASLEKAWPLSHEKIQGLRRSFAIFVLGVALELAGLLGAVVVRQGTRPPKSPAAAGLHLTRGYLNRRGMGISGELAAGAQGNIQITVTLLGAGGKAVWRDPVIHQGHFSVFIPARDVAPLRSATYTITWAGSSSVASASLVGELARCPEDCQ